MSASRPNLTQKALPGLHDAAFGALVEAGGSTSSVLDLGAGAGAWAMRLKDAGFVISASDLNTDGFKARDIPFTPADLNGAFSQMWTDRFSWVTALEVIEHVENPRHFLRQCRSLLKPDGRVLITTPNIECLPARLRFLRNGSLRMFDRDPRYNDPTHITPIHSFMFEKMVKDTGFKLLHHSFLGSDARASHVAYRVVSDLIKPFVNGITGGDNHIFILGQAT